MPLNEGSELFGTNADGTRNEDYCTYCYKDGAFNSDETMEEMIESCIPHVVEAHPEMSADEARKEMQATFPSLKRWKKN